MSLGYDYDYRYQMENPGEGIVIFMKLTSVLTEIRNCMYGRHGKAKGTRLIFNQILLIILLLNVKIQFL